VAITYCSTIRNPGSKVDEFIVFSFVKFRWWMTNITI